MGYETPADVGVSDDRAGHLRRNSAEPGTDYKTAFGTDLRAPEDFEVIGVDHSNGGAEGRRLTFLIPSNGEVIDWIHLQKINAKVGDRGHRGQKGIALSGASGFGKDWYYGPHVHVTRRARRGLPYRQTLDFEAAVGPRPAPSGGGASTPTLPSSPTLTSQEEDMPINFKNPVNGTTYTMIPGILITPHANGFGSRLTNFVNTGVWPHDESDDARYAVGLRNLNPDHVTWMLPHYGFHGYTAHTLPSDRAIYATWLQADADRLITLQDDEARLAAAIAGIKPGGVAQIDYAKLGEAMKAAGLDVSDSAIQKIAKTVNDDAAARMKS